MKLSRKKYNPLLRAGTASLFAGLILGLSPMAVMAQDQADEDENQSEEQSSDLERITVTGSRLSTNDNVVAPNPVLTVGAEEIDAAGVSRIEDLTNQLPQIFASQASEVSNGASGTAQLDMRGLGAGRTLTLIDGRRLPFGSALSIPANLNLVPTQLVERVEIVTGGASAVYGSDAIAGVANFILKDDYEGLEIDVQGSIHQSGNNNSMLEQVHAAGGVESPGSTWDGEEYRIALTMGTNAFDGRGNVVMHVNYENTAAITQDDRVTSACALASSSGDTSYNGLGCAGSGNYRLFAGPNLPDGGFMTDDGTIIPYVGTPNQTHNYGPLNFFQRPTERFQIYSKGTYELTDNIEFFADLSYNNTSSDAQVAESASFGGWSINCDNPFIQNTPGISLTDAFGCNTPDPETGELPTDVGGIVASHRNVEGGPRNSKIEISTFRTVAGIRGTFASDYDFEVFSQYASTDNKDISTGDFVIENVQDAFFVVEDENGNPVCRSGNPQCVPYNIFERGPNGETKVDPAALDFLQGTGVVVGNVEQLIFGGNIQTDLGRVGAQSPFADSGLGLLLGAEYRQDELESIPDQISQQPDGGFTGVGGPTLPVSGEVAVTEFFAETQLPLVTGAPMAEQLVLGGAYRYSDYEAEGRDTTNDFSTDTYHAFLNWTPVESVRLRAQFQRAVRAPNVIELYTGQGTNLPNLSQGPNGRYDPCATSNPSASFEECARTGVTQAQYGNILDVLSGQTQSITGGNPFLEPEESDTVSYGLIFTPTFADGLTLSVDYFDITVDDAISGGASPSTILSQCLETGNPTFCDLIERDDRGSLNSGTPGVGFTQTNVNIASLETKGLDLQASYDMGLSDVGMDGMGSVRFDFAATLLDTLESTAFPGADPIDCAGFHAGACGAPSPEYRHRMLTTWNTPWDLSLTATWRFYDSTESELGQDIKPVVDRKINQQQYLDLAFNYDLNESFSFRGGVNNVFGDDAPIVTSSGPPLGNGNTYPTVYDIGRYVFLGATFRN